MRIIIAIDGTDYGKAALERLCQLGLGNTDEIRVVSVIDMAMPMAIDIYGGYLPDTSDLEKTAKDNADKYVNEAVAKLGSVFSGDGVRVSSDVLFGTPESRIVELAEEWKADLIVVGSHGYRRWERILLGSVSNSIVHHAPCSVMVVRRSDSD
ncbi:MAG: universal stress protein [Acidobacteriota bacterium]|nr:MAG: universal stress protein [Acidobacteriota bacterium]